MKLTALLFTFFIMLTVAAMSFAQTLTAVDEKKDVLSLPKTIVIDPGHPSETSRGCAHHGLDELQICWDVALKLEKLVTADSSLTVVKSKNAVDTLVTNRQRAEIANAASAAIMIRLHCDSGKGSGCTLYYPDRPGTVQGVTGPSVSVIEQSRRAAMAIQAGLEKNLAGHLRVNPIKTDSVTYVGSKQGALTGSIFSEVPAVVVEMVYLNNASDAAFIGESANQDIMAAAIFAGIKKFLTDVAD